MEFRVVMWSDDDFVCLTEALDITWYKSQIKTASKVHLLAQGLSSGILNHCTEEDFPLVGPSLLQRTVFSFALRIISLAADCIYSLFFCCVPLKKKFIFAICSSATHEIVEDSIKILPFPPLLQAEQALLSPLQVRCCSPQQSYWCSNEVKPVYQCIFLHESSISWQYMNGAK